MKKNAIILASGLGSRFVPITYEIPKGLIKVDGVSILERQILDLINSGIDDIIMVVGHLSEKYQYLSEKYGVKMIYNSEYMIKNNLASLYLVRKYLGNTYILSSDNYITKNLYNNEETDSWYAVIETKDYKKKEWFVELDSSNRIKNFNIGNLEGMYIYGPAFINKNDSKILINYLEKIYFDENLYDSYWEYALLKCLPHIDLYARKEDNTTIYEFESLEELREFNKNYYIDNKSYILDKICEVLYVDQSMIFDIEPIKEGLTNNSFKFKVGSEEYICRVPGEGTEKMIDRKNEYKIYMKLKDYMLTDEVIYFDEITGFKISKYYSNAKHIDLALRENKINTLKLLKKIHFINIEEDYNIEEINLRKQILRYEGLCLEYGEINLEGYNDYREKIFGLLDRLDEYSYKKTLIHMDVLQNNFLVLEDKILLIDWEYAGLGDPLLDIALYVLYEQLDYFDMIEVLNIYFDNNVSNEDIEKVNMYISVGGFMWALWARNRERSGINLDEYTNTMYNLSKIYYYKL